MDRKEIFLKINEIIADINKQYQNFDAQPNQIKEIDLELFTANAKFLADYALILQRLTATDVAPAAEILPVIEPDQQEVTAETTEIIEESQPISIIQPAEDLTMPVPEAELVKPSVNDLLANQVEENRAAKFGQEPVKDLKSIISLNDKLVFIKDLFSGYSLAYQEAIDLLNKLEDFESADQYLQANYVEQYKWTEKEKTVDKFYELLNRRFAK